MTAGRACLLVLFGAFAAGLAAAEEAATVAGEEATEAAAEAHDRADAEHAHSSRLTDEYIPLQVEAMPQRPRLLIELGNPYLGTGLIKPGKQLPNGAVWQPTFIAFGTLRTALQTTDFGGVERSEWASRLDLFGNLQLTGTERVVIGFRNLDEDGRFTRYTFEGPGEGGFEDELNAGLETLYFEGDFGEIFPGLDREDFRRTDVGFSIGRQPLIFQEGMLINDSVDGIGITRNTLLPKNTSNFRVTFFLGLDDIDRSNVEDESATLAAILTSTDLRRSTVDVDLAYVRGDATTGDLANLGVSAVQRFGKTNSTFRVLASAAVDEATPFAGDGTLLYSEWSWTPHRTHDLVYVTTFAAFDEYTAAAAGPSTGGPLGPAGIGFASVGLGSFGAPLSNRAHDVAGGAVGYQRFFAATRRQVLAELAARVGTASDVADEAALSLRYQAALGRRFVVQLDGFGGRREALTPGVDDATLWGGRVELRLKF